MAKITVIGSFVMDHVARMQRFPLPGESVVGESIATYPGGKGMNQCVSVARLGGDVEMIGMLGKDAAGAYFHDLLQAEHISHPNVFECDLPTAVAQIQIDANGENRICVILSANYAFDMAEVEKIDAVLRRTELVVLQLELQPRIVAEIMRRAHAYGTKILLNPAPAMQLDAAVLALADYLTPNEIELASLTGLPTETEEEIVYAAQRLIAQGVPCVIVTLGAKGALLATADGCQIVPGYKVQAVDTVAAGDSFNGALAVALLEGKSILDAIRFANGMGALTVQKKGAIPSLHRREDLDAFLQKQA